MALRNHTTTEHELLPENELIAMYMREVTPGPHGIYATSQMSNTLVKSLQCSETKELQKGLNLIEYISHEGLELEYGTPSRVPAQRTKGHVNSNSSTELSDVTSVDTCGNIRYTEEDSDFEETDSLMECGDAMHPQVDSPVAGPGGSAAKFNLYKLLDAIQSRHLRISSGFQEAHTKLEGLRDQNRLDSIFLGKLNASNELMREKIHEMKSEITDIFHELELMKKSCKQDEPTSSSSHQYYEFPLEPWSCDSGRKSDGTTKTAEYRHEPTERAQEAETIIESPEQEQQNDLGYDNTELNGLHESLRNIASDSVVDSEDCLKAPRHENLAIHNGPKLVADTRTLSIYPTSVSVLFVILLGCWLALTKK